MKVLFWIPPWPVNGDSFFFVNAMQKHLLKQANSLVAYVEKVDFVVPELLLKETSALDPQVNILPIPLHFIKNKEVSNSMIYRELYLSSNPVLEFNIEKELNLLFKDNDYDIILLWETPAPFLKKIFPDAVIINQMPGIFSRPPYPHTVIFDPVGLYNLGMLCKSSAEIQQGIALSAQNLIVAEKFVSKVKNVITALTPFEEELLVSNQSMEKIGLLPLQVSEHYAFKSDTNFDNQLEFLIYVLENSKNENGIVATQYISKNINDMPLNENIVDTLRSKFSNLIYSTQFDKVDTCSQYLLPFVDNIITASSSIGLQAFAWSKKIKVIGNTYLKEYDYQNINFNGLSYEQICLNTISYLINYHQPLASAVVDDGKFLYNLLSEISRRKKLNKNDIDLLPCFSDIDENYSDRLLDSFRCENAKVSLNKVDTKWIEEKKVLNRIRENIEIDSIKVISFDVFDTVICRPFEKPADLFKFLDLKALNVTKGIVINFGQIRLLCEVETRKRLINQEEITLDDIYHTIHLFYNIPLEYVEVLKKEEIKFEIQNIKIRPFGKKIFKIAKESGKKICFTSDMYLPASVVKNMLENTGYTDNDYVLFVSSSHNKTKKSGSLYNTVLDHYHVLPSELLHFGDNKETDINSATNKKINCFRWASAIDWMRSNPVFKNIYHPRHGAGEKARSAIAGLTALGLFDGPLPKHCLTSLTGGDEYRLGYAILGPLIAGFSTWLLRKSIEDNVSHLYFVSREGWILKEALDILCKGKSSIPKTTYFYGSRRSIRVAACKHYSDILSLAAQPYDPCVPLNKLMEGRFGLKIGADEEKILASNGIENIFHPLTREFSDRQIWFKSCKLLSDKILVKSEFERNNYMKYLDSIGLLNSDNSAIVEIGWKGNIQGALGEMISKKMVGYYFATIQDSELWLSKGDKHHCYFGKCLSSTSSYSVIQNRHLLEYLMCHKEPSFTNMTIIDGQFTPKFRAEENLFKRFKFIETVHRGALDFVKSYADCFNEISEQIYIEPQLAEKAFSHFVSHPSKDDAMLLSGHYFEDLTGGVEKKYLIKSKHQVRASIEPSVWRKGEQVLFENAKKNIKNSLLPEKKVENSVHSHWIESLIVKKLVNKKKFDKYKRDRIAFFCDSKNKLTDLYYRFIVLRKLQ